MVVAGEVALGRTQPHHDQHDRAQQHVRAVEAGQHEERRPVDARAQRQVQFLVGVDVFLCLQGQEAEHEHNGQAQPEQQLAADAGLQCVMGDGQGHAGSEQDQRVDQRQAPGRDGLERTTDRRRTNGRPSSGIALPEQLVGHHPAAFAAQPRQAEVTGVEQRAEEGAEEHHFGEDEPDHAHPERANRVSTSIAMPR
ncbi:hypothetical protein G6F60_013772 [Rhizopus arrhizus]|nr:hypothetical protein G6F60_013772 [Rhizopus arrhizus]